MKSSTSVLVIGDYIEDAYVFGEATRLCPEAPVPVIVPTETRTSPGGAALVAEQLTALGTTTFLSCGSLSRKERIYAGTHMLCRVDVDAYQTNPPPIMPDGHTAVVVSDYGKGTFTWELARRVINSKVTAFVDAKHHWEWFRGAYAAFPNEMEAQAVCPRDYAHIVAKQGREGCLVDGQTVPPANGGAVDVCGAGDIFLAGFVHAHLKGFNLIDSARFANALAGESVRHLGTYVVPKEFADRALGNLRTAAPCEVLCQQADTT